jgi:hypothetical protein
MAQDTRIVHRRGYTLKHISIDREAGGAYRLTAVIGQHEVSMAQVANVKGLSLKLWQNPRTGDRRLYVNVYKRGRLVYTAHFEEGLSTSRGWYLRSGSFADKASALEIAGMLKQALPHLQAL